MGIFDYLDVCTINGLDAKVEEHHFLGEDESRQPIADIVQLKANEEWAAKKFVGSKNMPCKVQCSTEFYQTREL